MGKRVAFLGLGVMGHPMAGHLARTSHEVSVFNRTRARAEDWVSRYGGSAAATPAEAASGAELVFCCLGNDEHVAQVLLGPDGALAAMAPGSVLVDHTTGSAALARELAKRAYARGLGFLDAPVSGGQIGAEQGALTVMVGGRPEDFARAEPSFAAYARCARLLGPAGSGQLAKMVNQICIAGVLQGLAEGLYFAEQAGLDPAEVVDVIKQGAAQSWQMEQRHASMIEGRFDFGFAVEWMRKDLGLALDEARSNGARLPMAALVDQFYAAVEGMGGQRWDTSSLIQHLRGRIPGVHSTRP
jgi:3-hydroxyisobutyrate dehydrogenase-like beta-hydroxyacid dehydrogenase